MLLIKDIFGCYPTPKTCSKAVPIENPDPSLIYGVELEIENCLDNENWKTPGITAKTDGSLRNNGLEFVTAPMTYSNLTHTLNLFFSKAKLTEANHSERTSTHVHINVADMTEQQLATVLLLYVVYEQLLFRYAGKDRDKNIFCVPWNQTSLGYSTISEISAGQWGKFRSWQKYTALNLLPLGKYGSIEFRHLPGSLTAKYVLDWCAILGCMTMFSRKNTYKDTLEEIKALNTTSAYKAFSNRVFGQHLSFLDCVDFDSVVEEGVLEVKYCAFSQSKVGKPNLTQAQINNIEQALDAITLPRAVPAVAADEPVEDIMAQRAPVDRW